MDIIDENFDEACDRLEQLLPTCDFVAFDEEMSGIQWNSTTDPCASDSLDERFVKMVQVVSKFDIIQFGICLFHRDENGYVATPFNFFVYRGKGITDSDGSPSMRHSTLSHGAVTFLNIHDLDYNKWLKSGVGFISSEEERLLLRASGKKKKKRQALLRQFTRPQHQAPTVLERKDDTLFVEKILSDLKTWLSSPVNSKSATDSVFELPACNSFLRSAIFDRIWEIKDELTSNNTNSTSPQRSILQAITQDDVYYLKNSNPQKKKILVFSDQAAIDRYAEETDKLEDAMVRRKQGFRRVFNMLVKAKKPLIGHNCSFDLIFMLHYLHKPLRDNLLHFRQTMSRFFPLVYDTKVLASCKALLPKDVWPELQLPTCPTGLEALYRTVMNITRDDGNNRKPGLEVKAFESSIPITMAADCQYGASSNRAHEAAYDAYMTGCVFAQLFYGGSTPLQRWDQQLQNVLHMNRSFFWLRITKGKDYKRLCETSPIFYIQTIGKRARSLNQKTMFGRFAGPNLKSLHVDDSSCFVVLADADQNMTVKDILPTLTAYQEDLKEKDAKYCVKFTPYQDYLKRLERARVAKLKAASLAKKAQAHKANETKQFKEVKQVRQAKSVSPSQQTKSPPIKRTKSCILSPSYNASTSGSGKILQFVKSMGKNRLVQVTAGVAFGFWFGQQWKSRNESNNTHA